MFFPATAGDEITLDPDAKNSTKSRRYRDYSTVIMCNPNAVVYQWMVTAANAYWLDFFLRREVNVLIWNYRGYGLSE